VHITKKNTEALVVANNETGLEVNADKNKCIIMSRDRNAGRNDNTKTDSKFPEGVEQFKHWGKILWNQNSIQEEIKS
jgi:hypothetical protein